MTSILDYGAVSINVAELTIGLAPVISGTTLGSNVINASLENITSTNVIRITSSATSQSIRLTGSAADPNCQVVVVDPSNPLNQLCFAHDGSRGIISAITQGVGAAPLQFGFDETSTINLKGTQLYTKTTPQLQFRSGGTGTSTFVSVAKPTGGNRTYTMVDVGASADFVMTAGVQTISGAKTFSDTTTLTTSILFNSLANGGARFTSSNDTNWPITLQNPSGTRAIVTGVYLTSGENRPTIGGHSGALDAWEPMWINWGGVPGSDPVIIGNATLATAITRTEMLYVTGNATVAGNFHSTAAITNVGNITTTGNLIITNTNNASIAAASQTVPSTYTIPNVGSSDFVMTAGAQTIAGSKTFSGTIATNSITSVASGNNLNIEALGIGVISFNSLPNGGASFATSADNNWAIALRNTSLTRALVAGVYLVSGEHRPTIGGHNSALANWEPMWLNWGGVAGSDPIIIGEATLATATTRTEMLYVVGNTSVNGNFYTTGNLNVVDGANTATIDTTTLTASRTHTLQDDDGTIAFTDNITEIFNVQPGVNIVSTFGATYGELGSLWWGGSGRFPFTSVAVWVVTSADATGTILIRIRDEEAGVNLLDNHVVNVIAGTDGRSASGSISFASMPSSFGAISIYARTDTGAVSVVYIRSCVLKYNI